MNYVSGIVYLIYIKKLYKNSSIFALSYLLYIHIYMCMTSWAVFTILHQGFKMKYDEIKPKSKAQNNSFKFIVY